MEFYEGDDPGTNNGAVIFLYIESEREKRIAFGGPTSGEKMVTYTFVLDCFFRSTSRKTQDVGANNDVFLDSLTSAIRANRIAGAPGVIFSWGEGQHESGGDDIQVTSYYPRLLNGAGSATQVVSSVRVTVLETLFE
jgi:hypothetical protein